MRRIDNDQVTTLVFEGGTEDMAIEHVGHDQDNIQMICGRCTQGIDIGVREIAETLAVLLEVTGRAGLARDVRYRILPGIKD